MKKVLIIVSVLLVAICGMGYFAMKGMAAKAKEASTKKEPAVKVEKTDLSQNVVDTGVVDAGKTVEVKSRVSGRVAKLFVDEGATVTKGQLIAIIDPKETQLKVEQDRAQLRGARSAVRRAGIEIRQRNVTSKAAYERAKLRIAQLEKELNVQPTLTNAGVKSAEAAYQSAIKRREELVRVTHPNERSSVNGNLEDSKSSLENAEREYNRKKDLAERGYVPQREAEAAKLQYDLAKSKFDTAQTRKERLADQEDLALRQADEQIKQTRADLDRAMANRVQDAGKREELLAARQSLRDAEAALSDPAALMAGQEQTQASADQIATSLRDSERQLGETEIRSPIDGVVTKKLVQEGELVTSIGSFSNGTPIMKIEDRTAMLVKLQVNEIDVTRLKLNMAAKLTVDSLSGKELDGLVTKIAPSSVANEQSGSTSTAATTGTVVKYNVEVEITTKIPELKSGMSARCTLVANSRKGVLAIPAGYIGKEEGKKFVLVKSGKSTPEKKFVTTGLEASGKVEILNGVNEGAELEKPEYKGPPRAGAFGGPGDGGGGG